MSGHASYAQPVSLEVNAQKFEPLPIAIPDFQSNAPKIAIDIKNIVENNLKNSGLFRVIPSTSYLEKPQIGQVPNFENWRPLGAAALLVADVQLNDNKTLQLSFRLWDSFTGQQLFGQKLSGQIFSLRRLAHKMSDAVYTQLTGEGPYFDSKIIFIDETGSKKRRRKRLAIMDQDGANMRYLTPKNEYVLSPRYSMRAQRVVFTTLNKSGSSLHLMDPSTGARERIIQYRNKMVFSPALSPDGQKIAMSVENGGNTDIYIYNIATRRMYPLTSGFSIDTSPSFSPDGQQIVFNSDRGGAQQLYTMSINGGQPKRISYGSGRYATPVWSPKGDKIAFTKMSGGNFSIGIMSPDGTNERILASSFLDEAPSWAPNGRSVVFFRQMAGVRGQSALYKVDISGFIPEQRVKTPHYASDPSWSPLLN
ncbi:MAG: Tol-Pal system beta propeller repeat protein TolB [Pseudomonadota bacterium]